MRLTHNRQWRRGAALVVIAVGMALLPNVGFAQVSGAVTSPGVAEVPTEQVAEEAPPCPECEAQAPCPNCLPGLPNTGGGPVSRTAPGGQTVPPLLLPRTGAPDADAGPAPLTVALVGTLALVAVSGSLGWRALARRREI